MPSDKQGALQVTAMLQSLRRRQEDESYLLRLCQNCDWSNVQECCDLLTKVFQEANDYSYEGLKLRPFQQQLLVTDNWGNTPLHVMCFHKPPPSVVKALLNAAAPAAVLLQLLTMKNEQGSTPLVVACRAGACREVIHTFLHPPKQGGGLVGGRTVTIYDDQGITPFLALLQRYEMFLKIPIYKHKCPSLGQVQRLETSPEPEDPALKGMMEEERVPNYDDDDESLGGSSPHHEDERDPDVVSTRFWESVVEMMETAWTDTYANFTSSNNNHEEFISTLHGAAFLAECMPEPLANLILRLYKDQLRQSETILPLHLAIGKEEEATPSRRKRPMKIVQQQAYFIQRLLELDPSAVHAPIPGDTHQRSSFCQAIACGLSWNVDEVEMGPVQALFRHCPGALWKKDTKTGLYPFMLASSSSSSSSSSSGDSTGETADDICQLDSIYNLLRLCPESIQG
jgi:hypothetical protein